MGERRYVWTDSKDEVWYISEAGGLFYSGPLRDTPDRRLAEFTKHLVSVADALRAERDGLRAFAQDVVRQGHYAGDIDGFDLQDLAEKHGLLKPVEVTEPCCEDGCICAEYDDFPQTCYRKTELLTGKPSS